MVASRYALVRRGVLTPLATAKGLDYDTETLASSSTEEGQALGFVACGADLLLGLTDADGFPSKDRRTIKRDTKWVMKGAPGEGGQLAAIFLAQAMALSMELLQRRAAAAGFQAEGGGRRARPGSGRSEAGS
jgi:hypothetical protein